MSEFIQHPAASIRLAFSTRRAAWLVLLVTVVAVAVVLIASNANNSTTSAQPAAGSAAPTVRYDGGPDEGTAGPARTLPDLSAGPLTGGRTVPLHGGFNRQP
jgi:hypothetical protein